MQHPIDYDAIVIGGGFYGCTIALYLQRMHGFKRVLLIEQASSLLTHASYNNQARVHGGYHYPRSYITANRSQINAKKFIREYHDAIENHFTKLYGIAKHNSKITAAQFVRFCQNIGAKLQAAPQALTQLFTEHTMEEVFIADEVAFNATTLKMILEKQLAACDIEIKLNTKALALNNAPHHRITLETSRESFSTRWVFNCTYSGINQFCGDFHRTNTTLKYEIAELALIELPEELKHTSITIMDGPFFSIIPFAPENCHALSHVRYTPHCQWTDTDTQIDPYQKLEEFAKSTRYPHMLRDASRFIPLLANARYKKSLFEVKTILLDNELDDGRPILLEKNQTIPHCISILGGKIDNIYDVLASLSDVIS